eukprot:scaffold18738_cov57-Attheya_sp.AAC.7
MQHNKEETKENQELRQQCRILHEKEPVLERNDDGDNPSPRARMGFTAAPETRFLLNHQLDIPRIAELIMLIQFVRRLLYQSMISTAIRMLTCCLDSSTTAQ